jgi:hypothetical protein
MKMNVFDLYDNKIAYYATPKCGTRSILGWAVLIKEPNLLSEHPEWFSSSREKIEYSEIRQRANKYKKLTHDQKIRFCVVRDPVERFVSTFTNRLLYHKKPKINIGISEFIANFDILIKNSDFVDAEFHFKSQVDFLGKDASLYTNIFNLNEIHNVKKIIETEIGKGLPDLHLNQNGNIKKPELNLGEIDWIKRRYEMDYAIYGKWLYK